MILFIDSIGIPFIDSFGMEVDAPSQAYGNNGQNGYETDAKSTGPFARSLTALTHSLRTLAHSAVHIRTLAPELI